MELDYFKIEEFDCPCCGKNNMDQIFVEKLDLAREYANTLFKINSGTRCEKRNFDVGSTTKKSSHLFGYAADISCTSSHERHRIITALIKAGFNRIGIAKTFIHVDNDPNKIRDVIWTY